MTNTRHDATHVAPGETVMSRQHLLKTGAGLAAGVGGLTLLRPGSARASSLARAPQATSVTINMWTHDNLYVKFFTARAKEWATQHPQYSFTFNFVQIPYAQLFTKVLANLSVGSGAPDLVGIEISSFSRFMNGGIDEKSLVDLTPLIGSQRDQFVRWTPYTDKGHIYGVESSLSPVGMYYREDILKQAGVNTPITTYDDLLVAGRMVAKQGKYILMVPQSVGPNSPDVSVFMEMFLQAGGEVFDSKGNLTLDDPRAVKTLTFLVNGVKDKIFFAPPDMYSAPSIAALKLGRVAGVIMPDWYSGYYIKPNAANEAGKWRLQPMPAWNSGGTRVSAWGGTGFAITKQSKHPDLVWSLLHYAYMTETNQVKRFQELGYFPTMKAAMRDPRVINVPDPYYGGQKIGGVFASATRDGQDIPQMYQSPYWNDAMTQLSNEYSNAILGRKTPSRAIADAAAEVKKIMKRGA